VRTTEDPGRAADADQQADAAGVEPGDDGEIQHLGGVPHAGAGAVQELRGQHDPRIASAGRIAQLVEQPRLCHGEQSSHR
jgi:hypothetical protein